MQQGRHYTWSGSGGQQLIDDKSINGYKDFQTGKWIDFGNGSQPNDYDLTRPSYGGSIMGASSHRVDNSNNAYALDRRRDTGGSLGIEEGGTGRRVINPLNEKEGMNERIAQLHPIVAKRLT